MRLYGTSRLAAITKQFIEFCEVFDVYNLAISATSVLPSYSKPLSYQYSNAISLNKAAGNLASKQYVYAKTTTFRLSHISRL